MQLESWWSGAAMFAGVGLLVTPALERSPGQTAPPAPPQAQQAPAGPGHDTFLRVCSGCHVLTLVTSQRKSADDWTTTVIEMRNRGANASDQDLEEIVQYLTVSFGPEAAPVRVNVNSASPAEIAGALSLPLAQGQSIVTFREKKGKFKDLKSLEQVPEVEAAKIEAAKDRIDF